MNNITYSAPGTRENADRSRILGKISLQHEISSYQPACSFACYFAIVLATYRLLISRYSTLFLQYSECRLETRHGLSYKKARVTSIPQRLHSKKELTLTATGCNR